MINNIKYKKLPITHDFMFGKIFSDPELCKILIEIIFGVKVDEIVYIESQVTISDLEKAKDVKLDILVKIGDTYYNIEMQNDNKDNLINRSIYYRHMIIKHALEHGHSYDELPKINIVFICKFDLFKEKLSKYTICNQCVEKNTLDVSEYGTDMFLTIHKYQNEKSIPLQNLLKYFYTKVPNDEFTNKIDTCLQKAVEEELWKDDYMKLGIELKKAESRGQARGETIGEARGQARGETIGKFKYGLETAQAMIETHDFEYISKLLKLPHEYVQALADGCSIDDLMEQYFEYED